MHKLIKRTIAAMAFLALHLGMQGANMIKIDATGIAKGQEAEMPVSCEADGEYIGFQMDISLPEGLSFAEPCAHLSPNNSATHQLSTNLVGNTLRVASFSASNQAYPDMDRLLYIKVKASPDFESGEIEISNAFFSTPEQEEVAFPNSSTAIVGISPEVESVTLSAASLTLKVGDASLLTATVKPEELADAPITWSSSDPSVASVEDGNVTALSLGSAIVTASCGNVSASCEVTVVPTPVESISLTPSEWGGVVGAMTQLAVTVLPENATNKAVVWTTTDNSVATVDAEGNVKAIAVGSATITATAADGSGVKGECQVTVSAKNVPASSISISQTEWSGKAGESIRLTAKVLPDDATNKAVIWTTSDQSIATVDSEGNVKAIAVGSATITATTADGTSLSASCEVTVVPTPVESISLTPSEWGGVVGDMTQLTATVLPENATNKAVIWATSDKSIATVDAEGNVKAIAVGSATITATAADGSGAKGECQVTVSAKNVPASSISISPTEWSGKAGESIRLTATVLPYDATNRAVVWTTSDAGIATVDSEGNVKAVAVGTAVITATTADGTSLSASCEVTVVPTPVESISLMPSEWGGVVGDMTQLTATVLPENATNKAVVWTTSDKSIATVDAEGNVKAIAVGSATITATAADGSGAKGECQVTVSAKNVPASSISISPTEWSGKAGESIRLTATVLPAEATNKAVIWTTSDAGIATVDAEGNVKAIAVGTAVITATTADGTSLSASCQVTVVPTPVESISLTPSEWGGVVGAMTQLTATVLPENATNKAVVWTTSDQSIATVDAEGNVKAIAVGSATITATAADGSGVKGECQVTVSAKNVPASSISISPTEWSGKAGESIRLTATVLPYDATNKAVIWATSDAGIATVDSEGNVKAIAVGTATITATTADGTSLSASCEVTVVPTPVESISLTPSEWGGVVGAMTQLAATVLPENATNKSVLWSTSDSGIATVDSYGNVKAVAVGSATITVTTADGTNLSASCEVTVVPTPVESISLSATEWTGKAGESVQLTATVLPEDATNKSVLWTTSDSGIATVDSYGNVKAVAVGYAMITATAAGTDISATCEVTVVPTPVESIALSPSEWGGIVGDMTQLAVTVLPETATNKAVVWTTSDQSIATVDAQGNVKAIAVGSATITATAADGSGAKGECQVTVASKNVPATSISISETEWSGKVGEGIQLTATVLPENATNKAVIWTTSDAGVATVDSYGNVKAVGVGHAVITATAGGTNLSASCQVTVVPTPVESISLTPSEWSGKVGESVQLTATVLPENATNKAVIWTTSDESVATVDAEGNVKAVAVGSATITATAADGSGAKGECQVTVSPNNILATAIVISATGWSGKVGESIQLTATVLPENATNKAVIWTSSDAGVATVDANGTVKAVKAGTAVITAATTDGTNLSATCQVTVSDKQVPATAIVISATGWSGKVGESIQLTATVLPDDATNKAVIWTSSDAGVASVDNVGTVKAVKIGTAVITATTTDGTNLSATCQVTVVPTPVETIALSAYNWSGSVGEMTRLTATVGPEDATNKAVAWTTSNAAIATVDAQGNVKAVAVGSATITATAVDGSGVKAECQLTVNPVLAESITIDPENWSGEVGETFHITAYVLPENATDKSLAWRSTDKSVATVDENGFVTTVGAGTCVIEVATRDGSGLKAECVVVTSLSGLAELLADPCGTTDVYTPAGTLLKRGCTLDELRQLAPGYYILRQGNSVKKVLINP